MNNRMEPKVTLTITTCKRYGLFKKTIASFVAHCRDLDTISMIIHYDDSSEEYQRELMRQDLLTSFPHSELFERSVNPEDIKSGKRHCEIMRTWKEDISNSDYVFHLEDDWEFTTDFTLLELVNFINTKPNVAYVGVSQQERQAPQHIQIDVEGSFWKWYYDHNQPLMSNLFYDTNTRSNLINWPYFGLRPGMHDVSKLVEIDNFTCLSNLPFELEFATRFSEKYIAYCTRTAWCIHIGDTSSYELNNSDR
jgi:hypothetical protein